MIVISDTTPIISLMKAGQLELLQKLFGVVYIPKAVYQELTENEAFPEEIRWCRSVNFFMWKQWVIETGKKDSLIEYII